MIQHLKNLLLHQLMVTNQHYVYYYYLLEYQQNTAGVRKLVLEVVASVEKSLNEKEICAAELPELKKN
jgi:hypothetical protein